MCWTWIASCSDLRPLMSLSNRFSLRAGCVQLDNTDDTEMKHLLSAKLRRFKTLARGAQLWGEGADTRSRVRSQADTWPWAAHSRQALDVLNGRVTPKLKVQEMPLQASSKAPVPPQDVQKAGCFGYLAQAFQIKIPPPFKASSGGLPRPSVMPDKMDFCGK